MQIRNLAIIVAILAVFSLGTMPKIVQATPDEGVLIRGLSEKVYVIESGLKRWIKTADIFNKLGYSWANIIRISDDILNNIPPGKDVASTYQYPDGTLIRGNGPQVYLIEKGVGRWILNPQIFEAKGFKWQNIIRISDKILSGIKKGKDISSDYVLANQRIQTWIISGPCSQYQETIPEINTGQVEFGYSGSDNQGNAANLRFETFLSGYDKDWQSSWSSYKRKIDLLPGTKTYTFYVRAKTQDGFYDTTPAFCKFTTKLSLYYQQVEIYSVRNWGTDLNKEQIIVRAGKLSEDINITGWTITTKKDQLTIPRAVKIIHPDSIFNVPRDLILESNERITIYGGKSPIEVSAYRLNKCERYFGKSTEYKDCFYANNQYSDFLRNEWQIYLNRTSEFLADKNEEVILKDKNGLVVDKYSY